MEDSKLLRSLQKRDPEALAQLIRSYIPYVLKITSNILLPAMTAQDAEECAADAFLSVWENAKSIRSPAALRGYLSRTARNKAVSRLRANRQTLPLEEDVLSDTEDSMVESLSRKEQRQAVQRFLIALPQPDREIFLHHYYYCQTVAVIAAELELNPSTVKAKLVRGRQKLKQYLCEGGFFDG